MPQSIVSYLLGADTDDRSLCLYCRKHCIQSIGCSYGTIRVSVCSLSPSLSLSLSPSLPPPFSPPSPFSSPTLPLSLSRSPCLCQHRPKAEARG